MLTLTLCTVIGGEIVIVHDRRAVDDTDTGIRMFLYYAAVYFTLVVCIVDRVRLRTCSRL